MKNLYYKHVAGRTSGTGSVAVLIVLVLLVLIGIWTDRNLDFWLSHFKGEAVNCPWWVSVLCLFIAPALLFLNLIGEVARLAI